MQNTIIPFGILMIISLFFLLSCNPTGESSKIKEARHKSDQLLDKIGYGTATGEFPEKYFPVEQTKAILNDLRGKCDFENRKGVFVNDVMSSLNGKKKVSFVYEFMLKCDTIRLINTYKLDYQMELYEFNLEPVEKSNPMVLKPENSLKF